MRRPSSPTRASDSREVLLHRSGKADFPIKVMCGVLLRFPKPGSRRGDPDRPRIGAPWCCDPREDEVHPQRKPVKPIVRPGPKDEHGIRCKRVARLMAAHGIRGRCSADATVRREGPRCRSRRRRPQPGLHPAAPTQRWVAIITFVGRGRDSCISRTCSISSRRVVGWPMRNDLYIDLVPRCAQHGDRQPGTATGACPPLRSGMPVHETRVGRRLRESGIVSSVGIGRRRDDNAAAESLIATIKSELLSRRSCPTRLDAELALFDFIEAFYNRRDRHSTIGMMRPAELERADSTQSK